MNPFLAHVPLHPRRDATILARESVIEDVYAKVIAGEFCLILGPKYSGRTTLLRTVKARLQETPDQLPVLIQPDEIDLTGDRLFLESLALLLQQALHNEKAWPSSHAVGNYKIRERADAFNGFFDGLLKLLDRKLILFFDSIEDIPPHLLVRLANIAHSIFCTREQIPFFKNVSFNFAGAVSLRYLTFSLKPEVSPFNVCSSIPLRDLTCVQARRFLEQVIDKFNLPFRADAVSAILEFVGGDLNLLQRIAGLSLDAAGTSGQVSKTTVEQIVATIVQTEPWHAEESLSSTARLVGEDPRTLDVVLDLLRHNSVDYRPSEVDRALYGAFDITYPEMTGAVILERPEGTPTHWAFRNKITEMFLSRHFTPQRITRTYLELEQFEAAILSCNPLLDYIRSNFESDVVHFDDSDLKEVLMVYISRIHTESSHEYGYELLARLLARGFGCSDVTYYEYSEATNKLSAVTFLCDLFNNTGAEYDVAVQDNDEILEVQTYRLRLFKSDAKGDELHIAMPLTNLVGDVTAVVTVHSKRRDWWKNLEARVRVMQSALQAMNIALSKAENSRKNEMIHSLRPLAGKDGPAWVFVAHEFSEELLSNLRDYLGKVATELKFKYGGETTPPGLLGEVLVKDMMGCRLALYEMSAPNNNVYFECGVGLGLNLPGILFVRQKKAAENNRRIPPLLEGVLCFNYLNYTSMVEDIAARLNLVLDSYWDNQREPAFVHFVGAKIPELSKRVKYAAVLDHDRFGDQTDYRRVVSDALSEVGLEAAYPLDEQNSLGRYLNDTEHENMPRLVGVMSLLRNADMIVGRVEDVRGSLDSHVTGQRFIGLGYAFGLNATLRTQHLKIQMTLLSLDHRGKRLDVPGDLRGYQILRYANLADLRTHLTKTLAARK